jgi:hypothetical protein
LPIITISFIVFWNLVADAYFPWFLFTAENAVSVAIFFA